MNAFDEENEPPFIIRHRFKLIAGLVLLAVGGAVIMSSRETAPIHRAQKVERIVAIRPPKPLPPPPPPRQKEPEPAVQNPQDDQMVMQEPVETDEQPQPEDQAKPDTPDQAPGPEIEAMGTNIKGDGSSNSWGLSGSGGGGIIGGSGSGGSGGSGGTRWGWYAARIQRRIEKALQTNESTKSVKLTINVRLWVDETGRISHAKLSDSSGDMELDRALEKEILTGLVLTDPPPGDMPQPILIRITGVRPD